MSAAQKHSDFTNSFSRAIGVCFPGDIRLMMHVS